MTNQEAIEVLKLNNPFMAGKDKENFSKAIDKGIEALKNQKSIIKELEKIKTEMKDLVYSYYGAYRPNTEDLIDIVDYHIKELKGENNE